MASGVAGHVALENFESALFEVLESLTKQVARDGEGAEKLIEVHVDHAHDYNQAKVVAKAIVNSPLVKTAVHGADPNWGRVVMAVGKSGATADRDTLSIWFGDVLVAERGWVSPKYREEDAAALMKKDDITIQVDLGIGYGSATVWTCDLTHGYIQINADYRS